jgi:hypothetical protein
VTDEGYRRGGLKALLTIESSPGRPASIPKSAIAKLKQELSDPEGFSSYGEIQTWLETVCGVKSVGQEDGKFEYFWLYGLVEPSSGESFFWEFCHFDSICFEKYLELFAQQFPEDLHIIQLDKEVSAAIFALLRIGKLAIVSRSPRRSLAKRLNPSARRIVLLLVRELFYL